jgi:CDP-diacylglycerol--glycerol-3-phosphate 3-phosphatidyltransferase
MHIQNNCVRMAVKKQLPNVLTTQRIICSFCIIFCKPLSVMFIILYITAGITDMLDGFVARKLNEVSYFGERYDSIADVIFIGVCLFKILPVLNLKIWQIVWIIAIAIIKGSNLFFSYFHHRKKLFLHTMANRATGFLLFLSPFFLIWVQGAYIIPLLCAVATFAAIQEGYYNRKNGGLIKG